MEYLDKIMGNSHIVRAGESGPRDKGLGEILAKNYEHADDISAGDYLLENYSDEKLPAGIALSRIRNKIKEAGGAHVHEYSDPRPLQGLVKFCIEEIRGQSLTEEEAGVFNTRFEYAYEVLRQETDVEGERQAGSVLGSKLNSRLFNLIEEDKNLYTTTIDKALTIGQEGYARTSLEVIKLLTIMISLEEHVQSQHLRGERQPYGT